MNLPNTNAKTPDVIKIHNIIVDGSLEASQDDESDDGSSQVTDTLHGENQSHHHTTTAGRRPFRSDSSRHGIITTDTDTKDKTPKTEETNDGDTTNGRSRGSAVDSTDDNDEKFETVDLTTEDIATETEDELTEHSTDTRHTLEDTLNVGGHLVVRRRVVDITEHRSNQIDDEDIIRISEETSSRGKESTEGEPVPITSTALIELLQRGQLVSGLVQLLLFDVVDRRGIRSRHVSQKGTRRSR